VLITNLNSLEFPMTPDYTLSDVTRSHYDFGDEDIQTIFAQENLRTRVAWVEVIDKGKQDTIATYYTYDIHGNVRSLLQQQPGLGWKRTDYLYDLMGGKVSYAMYQYGVGDQFIHKYKYDSDNRITEVSTSSDGYLWNRDALYKYYLHGPVARTELGSEEYRLQGLDYYYTLQGWIKGVNMPFSGDPGKDGESGMNVNALVGRDACSYSLGYYLNDFKPIKSSAVVSDVRDQLWARFGENMNNSSGLFNGNVSWMVTDLAKIGEISNEREKGMQAMMYKYDQLHRIITSRSLTNYTSSGFGSRNGTAYDEDYTYDGNGNILTLRRMNEQGILMDDFNYQYANGTNRLRQVKPLDANLVINSGPIVSNSRLYNNITVSGTAYVKPGTKVELNAIQNIFMDPNFQVPDGADFHAGLVDGELPTEDVYQYDAIGNLVRNLESNTSITWTPYGKVREVRSDSLLVSFRYNAAGHRIEKKILSLLSENGRIEITRYVSDFAGNLMAVYNDTVAVELSILGSDRIGVYTGGEEFGSKTFGKKNYVIANHLGNVLVVISDKVRLDGNMKAETVTVRDYHPFGLEMKGRVWESDSINYRYGFNGKEKDANGEWGDLCYDYGFRIYDPRIARFLSVDPLTKGYPWYTPYQFAGNKPIVAIDVDGLEESHVTGYRKFYKWEVKITLGIQGELKTIDFLNISGSAFHFDVIKYERRKFEGEEAVDSWYWTYRDEKFSYHTTSAEISFLGTGVKTEGNHITNPNVELPRELVSSNVWAKEGTENGYNFIRGGGFAAGYGVGAVGDVEYLEGYAYGTWDSKYSQFVYKDEVAIKQGITISMGQDNCPNPILVQLGAFRSLRNAMKRATQYGAKVVNEGGLFKVIKEATSNENAQEIIESVHDDTAFIKK
jgi:RHS repeat-associated protein